MLLSFWPGDQCPGHATSLAPEVARHGSLRKILDMYEVSWCGEKVNEMHSGLALRDALGVGTPACTRCWHSELDSWSGMHSELLYMYMKNTVLPFASYCSPPPKSTIFGPFPKLVWCGLFLMGFHCFMTQKHFHETISKNKLKNAPNRRKTDHEP